MKKTVLILARAAYEPPFIEIIEFAVESGFAVSPGAISEDGFSLNDGTEMPVREDEGEDWF